MTNANEDLTKWLETLQNGMVWATHFVIWSASHRDAACQGSRPAKRHSTRLGTRASLPSYYRTKKRINEFRPSLVSGDYNTMTIRNAQSFESAERGQNSMDADH